MKNISTILVLFITAFLLMAVCTGCSSDNKLEGAWFFEEGLFLWVFDGDGTMRMISPPGFNNYSNVAVSQYYYSIEGNELTLKNTSSSPGEIYQIKFSGNDTMIFKHQGWDEGYEFSRIKGSSNYKTAIVGTWSPVNDQEFDIHIGSSSYPVKELSFYNDSTYRISSYMGSYSGEYTFLFDGDALQMQSQYSRGEIDYELFGDKLLLIEFGIYNGEIPCCYLLIKE